MSLLYTKNNQYVPLSRLETLEFYSTIGNSVMKINQSIQVIGYTHYFYFLFMSHTLYNVSTLTITKDHSKKKKAESIKCKNVYACHLILRMFQKSLHNNIVTIILNTRCIISVWQTPYTCNPHNYKMKLLYSADNKIKHWPLSFSTRYRRVLLIHYTHRQLLMVIQSSWMWTADNKQHTKCF